MRQQRHFLPWQSGYMDNNKTVIKSISFQLSDPDELELYNHAMLRSNFSRYVKNLILLDMIKGKIGLLGDMTLPASEDAGKESGEKQQQVIDNSLDGFL